MKTFNLGLVLLGICGCTAELSYDNNVTDDASHEHSDTGLDIQPDGENDEADASSQTDVFHDTPIVEDIGIDQADTGPPPVETVDLFVASGHGGRLVVSCDDGRSWHETNLEDPNHDEGGHGDWAAQSLTYGDGVFLAVYGWAGAGGVRALRTANGFDWTQPFQPGDERQGHGVFADGKFAIVGAFGGSGDYLVSEDLGLTWTEHALGTYIANHKRIAISLPGLVMTMGDDGEIISGPDVDSLVYRPGPHGCGAFHRISGNDSGMLVAWGSVRTDQGFEYHTCVSTDGSETWLQQPSDHMFGNLIWTGDEFYGVDVRSARRTTDGVNWTSTRMTGTEAATISVVERGDTGTFVGIGERGDTFYRSSNGIDWETTQTLEGLRIKHIEYGAVAPSELCPIQE